METIVLNVADLDANDRSALERVTGHDLGANQRVVIQISPAAVSGSHENQPLPDNKLPDWCNVYEGLSDAEIAELEEIILTRANLSRSFD